MADILHLFRPTRRRGARAGIADATPPISSGAASLPRAALPCAAPPHAPAPDRTNGGAASFPPCTQAALLGAVHWGAAGVLLATLPLRLFASYWHEV